MARKATSGQESWWVLQAQSGSREALDGADVNRGVARILKAVGLLKC